MATAYAKQNSFGGTACGAASAARMCAILLLAGVVLSASVFVILERISALLPLVGLLLFAILLVCVVFNCPGTCRMVQ